MSRAILITFILCLAATASAQLAEGDENAVSRLLQKRLGMPRGEADAALLEHVRKHSGGAAGAITKARVRQALKALASDAEARCAVWLDEGEWWPGTTPTAQSQTRTALLRWGQLDVVLGRTVQDLVPEPPADATPSAFERLTGTADPGQPARDARIGERDGRLQVLAPALLLRVQTGRFPDWTSASERAALQRHLSRVDVLEIARHLAGAPP